MPWTTALLGQMDDVAPIHIILGIVALIGAIAFVVWIISAGVSQGMKSAGVGRDVADSTPPPPKGAFPVVTEVAGEGPGKFRISGVDQQTGMDVTEHVSAESAANAKVKAELRGIVVTRIDRV